MSIILSQKRGQMGRGDSKSFIINNLKSYHPCVVGRLSSLVEFFWDLSR